MDAWYLYPMNEMHYNFKPKLGDFYPRSHEASHPFRVLFHQKSTEQNIDLYSNESIIWMYGFEHRHMASLLSCGIWYGNHLNQPHLQYPFLSFIFFFFFVKKINSQFFSLLIRQIYFSNIHPIINKLLLYHAIQDRFAYNFKNWYLWKKSFGIYPILCG